MKKRLLIFLVFQFLLFTLNAQSKWSPRASMPDTPRYGGIGFSIGNYGYMGLGYNGDKHPNAYYNDFWQFDPSNNSWTRKANYPGKARFCPATFVVGNKGYVVTGEDSAVKNSLVECWQYNPTTDIWTQETNFPGNARGYAVGFAIGNKGYVGTGSQIYKDYCKDFWAYTPATNSWMQIADFGGIARFGASGFTTIAKGYVCFGEDSLSKFHIDMWEYDTLTNAWTQKSNYPGDSIYAANGFVLGTNIYVGTGSGHDSIFQYYHKFWAYNTSSDTWTQEANFPGVSRAGCSAFAIGDTGYLGLGIDSSGYFFNTLYRFLPDSLTSINYLPSVSIPSVFPNPFSNYTTIEIPNLLSENLTITCFDLMGRSYEIKYKISNDGNNKQIKIFRDELPDGMYLVKIFSEDYSTNIKIIAN